jgi:hypothetical protein
MVQCPVPNSWKMRTGTFMVPRVMVETQIWEPSFECPPTELWRPWCRSMAITELIPLLAWPRVPMEISLAPRVEKATESAPFSESCLCRCRSLPKPSSKPGERSRSLATAAADQSFRLLTSTEATQPTSLWTLVTTGSFDDNGAFTVNDPQTGSNKVRFYRLAVP